MLEPLWTALLTLTRIPARKLAVAPSEATIGRSAVFYPLIGAVLGGLAGVLSFWLDPFLPHGIVVLIILAFWALLTGALHEDGLADTFDAFGSQSSRDGILRVLKDSRVGTYGALALALVTLFRWRGLTLLAGSDFVGVLIAVQTLPRAGIVALAYLAGPANDGTGGELARAIRPRHVLFAAALAAGIAGAILEIQAVAPALACLATIAVLAVYFRRRLGGVTGDCLGAANQLQEVAVLLALLTASGGSGCGG